MAPDLRAMEAIERLAWQDQVAAAPAAFASATGLSASEAGGALVLALRAVADTQFNRILGLGIDRPVDQRALDAALAAMRAKGNPRFFLHAAPWAAPATLPAWLEARGLRRYHRAWGKFWRDRAPAPVANGSLQVREIGADRAADFALPVAEGFGAPPPFQAWLRALPGRPGWRIFVAYDGDLPVGGGALFVCDRLAWLGIAATAPAHRRRGAQQAVMAARIAAALDADCRGMATETGIAVPGLANSSWNNMRHCGFTVAYLRDNYLPAAAW